MAWRLPTDGRWEVMVFKDGGVMLWREVLTRHIQNGWQMVTDSPPLPNWVKNGNFCFHKIMQTAVICWTNSQPEIDWQKKLNPLKFHSKLPNYICILVPFSAHFPVTNWSCILVFFHCISWLCYKFSFSLQCFLWSNYCVIVESLIALTIRNPYRSRLQEI